MQKLFSISYPLHFDRQGRTATTTTDEHITEMLKQLLFTNTGERVNRPDFGSGIQQLIFAATSPELAAALQYTLKAAVQRWLSDIIELQSLEVSSENSTLNISIRYLVRRTNEQRTTQLTQMV